MIGHYANRCKAPKKKKEKEEANFADHEPALLMAVASECCFDTEGRCHDTEERCLDNDEQKVILFNEKVCPDFHDDKKGDLRSTDHWYLDNGASNHMTGDRHKFRDLDETVTGKVRFGDGSAVEIQGKGQLHSLAGMAVSGCSRTCTTSRRCATT